MAALRYAARTLGDRVLRQTQAAVVRPALEEQQRRLVSRLIHKEHFCSNPDAGSHGEKIYWKIQNKKEELYDLISEAERKDMILGWVRRQNRELLQHLSVQVEPRPDDPGWRYFRRLKRRNGFLEFGMVAALAYMVITNCSDRESDPKGNRTTVEKEDH